MSKKIAILQSAYIPWKGYFDLINSVDEFILLDDVQYTTGDWRNRNRIKAANGLQWLTIPVMQQGRLTRKIHEMEVCPGKNWTRKHWASISQSYSKATFFDQYQERFLQLYEECRGEASLSRVNYRFLMEICGLLGIQTKISWSMDYAIDVHDKMERLIALCKAAGAAAYLSGPAAKAYIDQDQFKQEGISLHFFDYQGYPAYSQLYGAFEHQVSIIDLIFNEGPKAQRYLKSFPVQC